MGRQSRRHADYTRGEKETADTAEPIATTPEEGPMDPHYYARYAMAGWILAAVVGATGIELDVISLGSISADLKDANTLVVIIVGATIGVGAPPAVGFLFERFTSVLLTPFGANMFTYDFLEEFSGTTATGAIEDGECRDQRAKTGPAVFHVCFYSHASEDLRSWARRRRTQLFASLSSATAIVAGLLLSLCIFHDLGLFRASVAVLFFALLVAHGWREGRYHRAVLRVWAEANDKHLPVRESPRAAQVRTKDATHSPPP